ncbi:MAG TPA: hypothetical protein VK797_18335, partial [Tepidisphaeraceae bacterium]|nr:hypothetical protein [Tepidisphaeraceae bacterium]
ETYREETVRIIEPHFAPKIIGTHTFSYNNGLLAVDFVKVERIKAASRPWRHRRTDHLDAEMKVTCANAGFSGTDGSESGP